MLKYVSYIYQIANRLLYLKGCPGAKMTGSSIGICNPVGLGLIGSSIGICNPVGLGLIGRGLYTIGSMRWSQGRFISFTSLKFLTISWILIKHFDLVYRSSSIYKLRSTPLW